MDSLLVLAKFPFRLIWWLVLWLARAVGKALMLPVLEQSHQAYLDRRRWQLRWRELQEGVEYKLLLESVLADDPNPVSRIYIRNVGAQAINRLDVYVVAHKGNLRYPDSAVVLNLPPQYVASYALRNIPLQDLWVDDKGIALSYDSFEVLPSQLIINNEPQPCKSSQPVWSPTYTDFLNGHWVRFLGRLFNIDAIVDLKTDRFHALHFSLVGRFGIITMAPCAQIRQIFRHKLFALLPNVAVFWLLTRNWALAIACWGPLVLRRRAIHFEAGQFAYPSTR